MTLLNEAEAPAAEPVVLRSYTCPLCKRLLSATKFEGLPIDTRCSDCTPFAEALEIRDQLKERATRDLAQCLDLAGAAPAPMPKLNELAGFIMEEWGGGRTFAHDLVADCKRVVAGKPGTAASQAAYKMIFKIVEAANKQQSEEDLANMTNAELHERNRLLALQIVMDAMQEDKSGVMLKRMLKATGLKEQDLLLEEIRRG